MSPLKVVLRIAVIVFAAEGLIMLALQTVAPAVGLADLHSQWRMAAIDATALVAVCSPLIYFLVIRPYVSARRRAEAERGQSEHDLQERVAELEAAQGKLERQGLDLTRLTRKLKTANDQANAANRAKSEFLAAMSHELRTPLNAIIGFSDMIKSEQFGPVGSPKYHGYAEDINVSGQHLLELINDILDLSKVESGSDELHEADVETPKVTRSVLNLVKQRAEKGGVELALDLPDDPPPLRADERKLKQILLNLLTNAVKFSRNGGTVRLNIRSGPDSGYIFEVVDRGSGMAPEDIPKALSQFRQVDHDLDRQEEGTGLGLPLTKALVEMHQGSLALQSEVGVGTTASVRFPAERIVWPRGHGEPSVPLAG
jgi:signal transduction histidine kinase